MISVETAPADVTDNQASQTDNSVLDDDLGLLDDSPVESSTPPTPDDQPVDGVTNEADPSDIVQSEPIRVRILDLIVCPDDEGNEVTIDANTEFPVKGIDDDGNVTIEHQGMEIMLEAGEFDVIEWSDDSSDVDSESEASEAEPEAVNEPADEDSARADESPVPTPQLQPQQSAPASDLSLSLAEYWDRLRRQEDICKEAEAEVNRLKEELKDSKRVYDAAVVQLRRMIGNPPERLPLFDGPADQDETPAMPTKTNDSPSETSDVSPGREPESDGKSGAGESAKEGGKPGEGESSDWRSLSIEELGLTPAMTAKLAENTKKKIKTFGDFADWTANYKISDLDGIGKKKEEMIVQAYENFWSKHPEYVR